MAGPPLSEQDNPQVIPRDPATDDLLKRSAPADLIGIYPQVKDAYTEALKQFHAAQIEADPGKRAMAMTAATEALKIAEPAYWNITDEIAKRGFNPDGSKATPQQTADNVANIAAAYARTAIEQAGANERTRLQEEGADKRSQQQEEGATARNDANVKSKARTDNITATLDLLKTDISQGTLNATQASDKAKAAFDAAGIQRDIQEKFAPLALPAGSQFFPSLGPGGSIAAMAAAMGLPFAPVQTGGTFHIDPTATTQPIVDAQNQNPMFNGSGAMLNAARALAGLGVPTQAAAGAR